MTNSTTRQQPLSPGSDIAGYRIVKDIGTGAASQLYLVQDPKSKHIWALKHVKKETEKDQRFLDQTEIEYSVGSQLRHQSIRRIERLIKNRKLVRVSEIYLLMEFVDGIPLDQQPPETHVDAAEIFQNVADALLYMHNSGFVHADIKPNNIIATDKHIAKVIDLGQSCRIGTVKERIQGTVDYIAPEQVYRHEITPATDVYNLGATIYWALTGQHIPTAMSKKSRNNLTIQPDQYNLDLPEPPNSVDETIPPEFSSLIMDCIQPVPSARPSMETVRNRLQVILVRLEAQQASVDTSRKPRNSKSNRKPKT